METTGIRPASRMSITAEGLTVSTSPTRPRSTSLAVHDDRAPAGAEQAGVLAGQPDGDRAVLVEQADELAAHLAGEDHPHDVHDLGGGDPQAAAELAGQADPVEHRGDLRPAAVDDDRAQAGVPQEHDVLREGRLEVVVDHGVAAVLDHDDGAPEALEPRQRLDEGLRLGRGGGQGGLVAPVAKAGHVLYAEFSWT